MGKDKGLAFSKREYFESLDGQIGGAPCRNGRPPSKLVLVSMAQVVTLTEQVNCEARAVDSAVPLA